MLAGIGLLDDDVGSQVHTGGAQQTHGSAQHIEQPQLVGEGESHKTQANPDTAGENHAPGAVTVHKVTQEGSGHRTGCHHERIIQGETATAKAQVFTHRGHKEAQCGGKKTHGKHQQERRKGRTGLVLYHWIILRKVLYFFHYRKKREQSQGKGTGLRTGNSKPSPLGKVAARKG